MSSAIAQQPDLLRGHPSPIFSSSSDSRELLVQNLKNDLGIFLAQDQNSLSTPLLAELYSTLLFLGYQGNLQLRSLPESGPLLVKLDGDQLLISPDAGSKTFALALENAKKSVEENPSIAPGSTTQAQITFNHELFLQLFETLLTKEQMREFFKNRLHLDISMHPNHADYAKTGEFSKRELSSLAWNLIDFPPALIAKLKLKSIVRFHDSEILRDEKGNPILGRYLNADQMIQVMGSAFEKTSYGEDTFLHELGHSVWASLSQTIQSQFIAISWHTSQQRKSDNTEWISEYSTTNPSEDFAEHFAAFLQHPESLESKAKTKYTFIHNNIFDGRKYFSDAHPKAKLHLVSDSPDNQAPWLSQSVKDSLSISSQQIDENTVEMVFILTGVKDDISGTRRVYFSWLGGTAYENACFGYPVPGTTNTFEGRYRYQLNRTSTSSRTITAISLEDNAGNDRWIAVQDQIFNIPGASRANAKAQRQFVVDTTRWSTYLNAAETRLIPNVGTEVILQTPFLVTPARKSDHGTISAEFGAEKRSLSWWIGPDLSEPSQYTGDTTDYENNSSGAKLHFIVPQELGSGNLVVKSIEFRFSDTPTFQSQDYLMKVPAFNIPIRSFHEDQTIPELKINEIKTNVSYLEKDNVKRANVRIEVPVNGTEDPKREHGKAVLRYPSGREINLHVPNFKTDSMGQRWMIFEQELPAHHESGTYIIEKITIGEIPGDGHFNCGSWHYQEYKLLERGIQIKIEIQKAIPTL